MYEQAGALAYIHDGLKAARRGFWASLALRDLELTHYYQHRIRGLKRARRIIRSRG